MILNQHQDQNLKKELKASQRKRWSSLVAAAVLGALFSAQQINAQCAPDATSTITTADLDYVSGWQNLYPNAVLNFPSQHPTGFPTRVYGATVEISSGYVAAEDALQLSGSLPAGINASVSGNTITFSGDQTPASYQAALRLVQYRNSNGLTGNIGDRDIQFRLNRFFPMSRCGGQRPATNEIAFDYDNAVNPHTPTGHAYVYNNISTLFPSRRAYANGLNLDGEDGYLVNETSQTESNFVASCFPQNTYAGASDNIPITGGREGDWYWVDGPEAGLQFLAGNCTRPGPCTVLDPDGAGPLGAYNPFVGAEPNDYPNRNIDQQEDYAERRWSGNGWNDIFTRSASHPSLVEFGNWRGCEIEARVENTRTVVFEHLSDLKIEKTSNDTEYTPGGTGQYSLRACNNGPQDVTGARVQDPLPTGVSVNGNWSCTPDANSSCVSGSPNGTTATGTSDVDQLVDIANGQCVTFTLPVRFAAEATGY